MKASFAAATMVCFHKKLTGDMMKEINKMTFEPPEKEKTEDDSQGRYA